MGVFVYLVFFALISFSLAGRHCISPYMEYEEGQRFFFFPDGNGVAQMVDVQKIDIGARFNVKNSVDFLLYTRYNPTVPRFILPGDDDSLNRTYFNNSLPVKIIAHGWRSDRSSDVNTLIVKSFLSVLDANIIVVDWSTGCSGLYTTSVKNVPRVGRHLSETIDWLIDRGVSPSQFHLMGHSLGAHVAAVAARNVRNGRIPILTAFDPANPLWGETSERVCSTDAEYVEVIHTNAGHLGLKYPVGDNDFYPNGGFLQPGCSIFSIGCAHSRSYEYFADSIVHSQGFTAYQCKDYNEIGNKCSNMSQIQMGGIHPKPSIGVFYLVTNDKVPFSLH